MSATGTRSPLIEVKSRAIWRRQQPVVADCSVVAAMVFEEAECPQAAALLADGAICAPTLLPYEIASVSGKKRRSGAPAEWLSAALVGYADLEIELYPVDLAGCVELAAHYKLSAYDAAYLWLAAELQVQLLTFDRRLAEAARQHLGGSAKRRSKVSNCA